ncbi:MAG TPA: hypothetical protein VFA60_10560 [Terriglobales bacterium]|nr:hypothetical protein [Terriglobales bacterium]
MNFASFYLVCFIVGFALVMLSFLLGAMQFHLHLPAGWRLPHFGNGHAHVGGVHAHATGVHAHGAHAETEVPFLNFSTIVAFLAWFGGAGYLLTHYGHVQVVFGFIAAVLGGLVGASIIFWFLVKLLSCERSLDAADYDRIGVLGTVNVPIREGGGTGEIIFSQAGTRRVSGARSDDGAAIPKGTEVVITRYERGLAYVRRWEELAGEHAFDRAAPEKKDL